MSAVPYPNIMKNVAGEEFGFELIIVPKDGIRERISQKRATGIRCLRQITCDGDANVMVVPQMYRGNGVLGTDTNAKAVRFRTISTDRSVRTFLFSFPSLFTTSGFFSGFTMDTFDL